MAQCGGLSHRGARVAKRQTIIKCDWSDNFGDLLEKLGDELVTIFHHVYTPSISYIVSRDLISAVLCTC